MRQPTIAIFGAGAVGTTTAYSLILNHIPAKILLIDIDQARCTGEILDLEDATGFNPTTSIASGTAQQAGKADIIVIAAGARQKPGQSRIELLDTNKKVVSSIVEKIKPINPKAIIIVVTNPLDILTLLVQEKAGLPRNQILGTGTFLDSQRLRILLSRKLNIAIPSIHAYILGEHGDTQFPAWSCSYIGGIPILNFPSLNKNELDHIAQEAQKKAYDIINCKGSTFYGIGHCVAALCETIIFDQKRIVPLSCYDDEFNICLSKLAVLGAQGIETILPLKLSTDEQEKFQKSAQHLQTFSQK